MSLLLQKWSHIIKDFGSLKSLVLVHIKHWVFGQITELLSSIFNFKKVNSLSDLDLISSLTAKDSLLQREMLAPNPKRTPGIMM